jgi:hypothetical protein
MLAQYSQASATWTGSWMIQQAKTWVASDAFAMRSGNG